MIRTLLLVLLAFAAVPASHAAERMPAAPLLVQAPAPSVAPKPVAPQEQMLTQRNSVYETAAIVAIAGGAGALAVALGSSGLVTALVIGGAAGIVYLASGG